MIDTNTSEFSRRHRQTTSPSSQQLSAAGNERISGDLNEPQVAWQHGVGHNVAKWLESMGWRQGSPIGRVFPVSNRGWSHDFPVGKVAFKNNLQSFEAHLKVLIGCDVNLGCICFFIFLFKKSDITYMSIMDTGIQHPKIALEQRVFNDDTSEELEVLWNLAEVATTPFSLQKKPCL